MKKCANDLDMRFIISTFVYSKGEFLLLCKQIMKIVYRN